MSKNDITGDDIKSRPASTAYRDNYDVIFGGTKPKREEVTICHYCHCELKDSKTLCDCNLTGEPK